MIRRAPFSTAPRFQFSLRALLLAMTLLCMGVSLILAVRSWLVSLRKQVDNAVVESIKGIGTGLEAELPRITREFAKQVVVPSATDEGFADRVRGRAVASLSSGTPDERLVATIILGELRPTEDSDVCDLIDAAEDLDPFVRAAAEESLLRILTSNQGFDSLLECIATEDGDSRAVTARRIRLLAGTCSN